MTENICTTWKLSRKTEFDKFLNEALKTLRLLFFNNKNYELTSFSSTEYFDYQEWLKMFMLHGSTCYMGINVTWYYMLNGSSCYIVVHSLRNVVLRLQLGIVAILSTWFMTSQGVSAFRSVRKLFVFLGSKAPLGLATVRH